MTARTRSGRRRPLGLSPPKPVPGQSKDVSQRRGISKNQKFWLAVVINCIAVFLVVFAPSIVNRKSSALEEVKDAEESVLDVPLINSASPTFRLPIPLIVVGYPKSGTTTVYEFFKCVGVKNLQHFCCCGDVSNHPPCERRTMAKCILNNMAKNRKMLADCGNYTVYAQIDGERPVLAAKNDLLKRKGVLLENGTLEVIGGSLINRGKLYRHFLPQHFYLERLHEEYPKATWILPLREPVAWANSAFNWFQMRGRFVNEYKHYNSSMKRPGKTKAVDWLARIYQEHTDFVRKVCKQYPFHHCIEINITDEDAGRILSQHFFRDEGIGADCWGHHNKIGNRATQKTSKTKKRKS